MVKADAALFTAVGHYYAAIAQLHLAHQAADETAAFKRAAGLFQPALDELGKVQECEKQLMALAEPIAFNAYYVRRHGVVAFGTEEFRKGLQALVGDLADGYYPAKGFAILNPLLARLAASWDLNARVEGVVTRIERSLACATDSKKA